MQFAVCIVSVYMSVWTDKVWMYMYVYLNACGWYQEAFIIIILIFIELESLIWCLNSTIELVWIARLLQNCPVSAFWVLQLQADQGNYLEIMWGLTSSPHSYKASALSIELSS